MLSKATVECLNKASEMSNLRYQEGGMIYLYKFGHRRAHSLYGYKLLSSINGSRELSESEKTQLTLFFASSLEGYNAENYGELTISTTKQLLASLSEDFKGMYAFVSEYEEDLSSKTVTLSFIINNDFHSLELFWSID